MVQGLGFRAYRNEGRVKVAWGGLGSCLGFELRVCSLSWESKSQFVQDPRKTCKSCNLKESFEFLKGRLASNRGFQVYA